MGVSRENIFGGAPGPQPAVPGTYGEAPNGFRLPDATGVGRVKLQVSDLARSLDFYEGTLGLSVLDRNATRAELGPHGGRSALVELHERPGTRPVPRRGRLGLYHFAILVPDRASLEVVSKLSKRDEHARRVEKRAVVLKLVLIARDEAAEVMQPRVGPFDNPAAAIAPQGATVLVAMDPVREVGHDKLDAATFQAQPERATVVAAVGDDALRVLFRAPWSRARDGYVGERFLREVRLGEIGRRKVHSERNTLAVCQYHKLCPLTFACFADASAPFFAGAKVPSMKASLQSSCCAPSRSFKNARQRSSQRSARSHSPRRRQHVAYAGYESGMSFHRAPVRRIQRIPSITARSSARGRPPLGFAFGFGISGAIRAHCASVSSTFITASLGERVLSSQTSEQRFRNHF